MYIDECVSSGYSKSLNRHVAFTKFTEQILYFKVNRETKQYDSFMSQHNLSLINSKGERKKTLLSFTSCNFILFILFELQVKIIKNYKCSISRHPIIL